MQPKAGASAGHGGRPRPVPGPPPAATRALPTPTCSMTTASLSELVPCRCRTNCLMYGCRSVTVDTCRRRGRPLSRGPGPDAQQPRHGGQSGPPCSPAGQGGRGGARGGRHLQPRPPWPLCPPGRRREEWGDVTLTGLGSRSGRTPRSPGLAPGACLPHGGRCSPSRRWGLSGPRATRAVGLSVGSWGEGPRGSHSCARSLSSPALGTRGPCWRQRHWAQLSRPERPLGVGAEGHRLGGANEGATPRGLRHPPSPPWSETPPAV